MVRAFGLVVAFAAGAMVLGGARAEDKPAPVTLKGTMLCASCALNETKKCVNVVQVKDGAKLVNYYIDDKGNGEAYHESVCGGGKVEGVTVTGTVSEKDGKKWVKATKIETPKK